MLRTPVSLLERLAAPQDKEAREYFVQLYSPLLRHLAAQHGLNGSNAADLVQDVFTVPVRKLPGFRYDPGKRFRGWLWTVTLNCRRTGLRGGPKSVRFDDGEGLIQAAAPDAIGSFDEEEYRHYVTHRALELMQADFQPATWKAFWENVVNERPAADVAADWA